MARLRRTLPGDFKELVAAGDAGKIKAALKKCEPDAYEDNSRRKSALMNPDLPEEIVRWLVTEYGDMYDVQKDWIEANINTNALKNKYRADNVLYLFFFNTDYSNQVNPWYLGYSCSPSYYIEFCNIYVKFDDIYVTKPPSYAHEIMHCFGAHDLYYQNEFIPQKYVDHLCKTYSNDIMFTVFDSKEITNEFSELDAYYVGLCDECEEVSKWHLAPSEHITATDN